MLIKLIFTLVVTKAVLAKLCTRRCYPGDSCYPSLDKIETFRNTLDGEILFPSSPAYHLEVLTWNRWFTKSVAMIVFVKSVEDVQKAMLFARKYNLHMTVRSSGHDFIGRSTGPGSFQINLSKMKNVTMNLDCQSNPAGNITLDSGVEWGSVYKKLDGTGCVVVGGSAHTVTQGGYLQGGGHSPISRPLGLAVDQILEMTVVTADGRIVTCSASGSTIQEVNGTVTHTTDTDLFWALRGGGGGTFGVVVKYTYKLHRQPAKMTIAYFGFALSYGGDSTAGRSLLSFYSNFVKTMPRAWGGYALFSNAKIVIPNIPTIVGTATFIFNYFGEIDKTNMDAIKQWTTRYPPPYPSAIWNVSTFWQYAENITDGPYGNSYLANTFVQRDNLNENFNEYILEIMTKEPSQVPYNPSHSCTGAHIGGKVSDAGPDDTPIHDGFRSGLISLSCSVGMGDDPTKYSAGIEAGKKLYDGLKKHGNGVYVNEPSPDMADWKEQFWGRHYPKLLKIKRKWDPENFLSCIHCVGSDLDGTVPEVNWMK